MSVQILKANRVWSSVHNHSKTGRCSLFASSYQPLNNAGNNWKEKNELILIGFYVVTPHVCTFPHFHRDYYRIITAY